eukprot:s978_g27.t1
MERDEDNAGCRLGQFTLSVWHLVHANSSLRAGFLRKKFGVVLLEIPWGPLLSWHSFGALSALRQRVKQDSRHLHPHIMSSTTPQCDEFLRKLTSAISSQGLQRPSTAAATRFLAAKDAVPYAPAVAAAIWTLALSLTTASDSEARELLTEGEVMVKSWFSHRKWPLHEILMSPWPLLELITALEGKIYAPASKMIPGRDPREPRCSPSRREDLAAGLEHQRVEAIVVYGRKDRIQILHKYLLRNLRRNGGVVDVVHFVVFAAFKEDMDYLMQLITENAPDYAYPAVTGRRLAKFYSICQDPDTVYLKIDDDMVYLADEAIPEMVRERLRNRCGLVSANVINHAILSAVHQDIGAIRNFFPGEDASKPWIRNDEVLPIMAIEKFKRKKSLYQKILQVVQVPGELQLSRSMLRPPCRVELGQLSQLAPQKIGAPVSHAVASCRGSRHSSQSSCVAIPVALAAGIAAGVKRSKSQFPPPRRSLVGCAATASASEDFLDFVGRTGSPAHTVAEAKKRLLAAGFVELSDVWEMKAGGKYFITKEGTSICAFGVGGAFDASKGGVVIAAAHTDSPCLKLRPCSKMPSSAGMLQIGVDTYGGGLWHTWFDRPLGVAGKVICATKEGMEEVLVRVEKPICLIPNLAIHLKNEKERQAFSPNKENELQPVLCPPCGSSLSSSAKKDEKKEEEGPGGRHHEELLEVVAENAGVAAADILDVDLCLMDSTPPCRIGAFVSTPRIDNVLSTWAAFDGLIATVEEEAFQKSTDLMVAASFDHEEVGSVSAAGADSAVLERWLNEALKALEGLSWCDVVSRSFLLFKSLMQNVPFKHGGYYLVIKRLDMKIWLQISRPRRGSWAVR